MVLLLRGRVKVGTLLAFHWPNDRADLENLAASGLLPLTLVQSRLVGALLLVHGVAIDLSGELIQASCLSPSLGHTLW